MDESDVFRHDSDTGSSNYRPNEDTTRSRFLDLVLHQASSQGRARGYVLGLDLDSRPRKNPLRSGRGVDLDNRSNTADPDGFDWEYLWRRDFRSTSMENLLQ